MTDRIEKNIELKAPVERVWRALTDHNEFGEWFRVKLDGPFIPGQVATGRILYPGYEHLKWEARIQRMDAPKLFSFTWHPYAVDADVDYSKEPPTLVEFRLEPSPNGTFLTIVESGFDALPPGRKSIALRMNDEGWTGQSENIRTYVER
ncbi:MULTISPECIES: SRPBCC family protein [unclassified Sinorhizobium]|uniref:SRPBCC family protein n=1 Tax=unclassified Sinorhizobium TaxID=2613772 RepID=UPI003524D2D2